MESFKTKLNIEMPQVFQYHTLKDSMGPEKGLMNKAATNFECTVFKKEDLSDKGSLIYSKMKTGKFPHESEE